ncbi:hypothetical protein D3C87_1305060 [compost metagenome]
MAADVYSRMEAKPEQKVFGVFDNIADRLGGAADRVPFLFTSKELAQEWIADEPRRLTVFRIVEITPFGYKD